MNRFIIKKKNLIIRDKEIYHTVASLNVRHIKLVTHKDPNGDTSIIAYAPPGNEYTLSKRYQMINTFSTHLTIRTPKHLSEHIGGIAKYYTERLHPVEGELFRIKPVSFNIDSKFLKYKPKSDIKLLPYFNKSNQCIVPHDYINDYVYHMVSRMSISFNYTNKGSLRHGFLFARIQGGRCRRRSEDSFNLTKCSIGMKVRGAKHFVEFMQRNNKNIQKYNYISTESHNKCPYGLIVFKEVYGSK